MALLAGIDLLAKFSAGSDASGQAGDRFRTFISRYFNSASQSDRDIIYQLRNALLHSFGLYSETGDRVYRFFLTNAGIGSLVTYQAPDNYCIDLRILHCEFEMAITKYQVNLNMDAELKGNFAGMFSKYGRVYIG